MAMEKLQFGWDISVESDEMNGIVKDAGKVVKRFRGETAWSDAERFANDLVLKRLYGK